MKARRNRKPWTRADRAYMRALARRRLSARAAAPLLGRTVGSTKWAAMIYGVHFRAIRQKPGTQRTRAQRERLDSEQARIVREVQRLTQEMQP